MTPGKQPTRATSLMSCDSRTGAGFSTEYCLNYHVISDILTINMLSLGAGRHREVPPRCRICCPKRRKGFNPCYGKDRIATDSRASVTRNTMDNMFKGFQSGCQMRSGIAACKRISGEWQCAQMTTIVSTSGSTEDDLIHKQYQARYERDFIDFGAFGEKETQWNSDDEVNKKNKVKEDTKRGDDFNGHEETEHSPSPSMNSDRQMPSTEILCILRHAHPDVALEMPPLPMQNANFQRYLVQCNREAILDRFQDRLQHGRIADENSARVVTHNGSELYRIVTVENVTRSNIRSKLFYAASAA